MLSCSILPDFGLLVQALMNVCDPEDVKLALHRDVNALLFVEMELPAS